VKFYKKDKYLNRTYYNNVSSETVILHTPVEIFHLTRQKVCECFTSTIIFKKIFAKHGLETTPRTAFFVPVLILSIDISQHIVSTPLKP